MIFNFRNFTSVHSMISQRNQIQIQWYLIPWIHLRVLFLKIPNLLISITDSSSDLIKLKEIIKEFSLIPCGFNRYLLLYPSIRDLILKLVSLEFILTVDRVFSMTIRSRSVNSPFLSSLAKMLGLHNLFYSISPSSIILFFCVEREKRSHISLSPSPSILPLLWAKARWWWLVLIASHLLFFLSPTHFLKPIASLSPLFLFYFKYLHP